ncbi:MAG: YihY family inner membrane protein [Deltaproteobacteria bacterium]|nr:MAG: YihY family inner membrane protein [Deltaproteobacteria bacterium]
MWRRELDSGVVATRLRRFLQLIVVIGEGFVRDHLLLRASALTYISLLSLIPLLALALAIVAALGVRENLASLIVGLIAAGSPQAAEPIQRLVEQVNFASLGTLGAGILVVTTILFLGNVEEDLNQIWGVHQRRPWVRRLPDYLALVVIGPLLLGIAISLATTLQNEALVLELRKHPVFETLHSMGLRFVPTLIYALALTATYWFLPNTRVRPAAALLGGVVGALLLTLTQIGYVKFNVGVAKYNAVFGGLAAFPLLFVWIYLSCAIMLLGAEVAFAYQNLELYRREVRGVPPGPAAREGIGLRIALEVARAFRDGAPPWTADALADALDVPVRSVRAVLGQLEAARIVSSAGEREREGGVLLARPAERIEVLDVLRALRGPRLPVAGGSPLGIPVDAVLRELEDGATNAAAGRTLADLLEPVPPASR